MKDVYPIHDSIVCGERIKDEEREEEINFDTPAEPSFDSEEQPTPMSGQSLPLLHSGWKKLILVYEDNTFEVLSPR